MLEMRKDKPDRYGFFLYSEKYNFELYNKSFIITIRVLLRYTAALKFYF